MMQAYLMLTSACNLQCFHCIRDRKTKGGTLSVADASRVIRELADSERFTALFLTGGEPTMHGSFMDILEYACRHFPGAIRVCTNGASPFFNGRPPPGGNELKKVTWQVSLDGDETGNDGIRGKGHYVRALAGLSAAMGLGLKVAVSSVVNPDNMDGFERLHDTLAEMGVAHWLLSPEMPFGNAEGRAPLPVEEWNCFVERLLKAARIPVRIAKLFDISALRRLTDGEIGELAGRVIPHCGSACLKVYIHPDLTVYPCTCLPDHPLGSLRRESIADILRGPAAEHIRNHDVRSDSPCRACRYYAICRGGCLGMSYHSFGVIDAGDCRCPLFRGQANPPSGTKGTNGEGNANTRV